jgi:rod shape-determining protein MreC
MDQTIQTISLPINNLLYGNSAELRQKYLGTQDTRNLAEVVREQESQIMKLQSDNAQLLTIKNDYEILQKYFKFFDKIKYDYIMAQVVARDVISHDAINRNKLIINRGEEDGIKVGLIVINQEGVAVGKITKTKAKLSEISLLNSPDCRLAVSIQNDNQTIGLAQGDLGLTVKLDFVPQSQKLSVGQLVVSSGLEPNVPGGIAIAKIKSVDVTINDIWQNVSLEPIANLDNLRWLSVLLPQGSFIFE